MIIFRLDGFEILAQDLIVANLLLKFLDVSFLPLSEGSLVKRVRTMGASMGGNASYLGSSILSRAFAGAKFPLSIALAAVAIVLPTVALSTAGDIVVGMVTRRWRLWLWHGVDRIRITGKVWRRIVLIS